MGWLLSFAICLCNDFLAAQKRESAVVEHKGSPSSEGWQEMGEVSGWLGGRLFERLLPWAALLITSVLLSFFVTRHSAVQLQRSQQSQRRGFQSLWHLILNTQLLRRSHSTPWSLAADWSTEKPLYLNCRTQSAPLLFSPTKETGVLKGIQSQNILVLLNPSYSKLQI